MVKVPKIMPSGLPQGAFLFAPRVVIPPGGELVERPALPERQAQILIGLASSKTIKELAFEFHQSPKTVEYHKACLMRRIRVYDLAGLTRYAIRSGLVSA